MPILRLRNSKYSKIYLSNLDLSLDAVWEAFGVYFVNFVMKTGWDEFLQALAYDLKVSIFHCFCFISLIFKSMNCSFWK